MLKGSFAPASSPIKNIGVPADNMLIPAASLARASAVSRVGPNRTASLTATRIVRKVRSEFPASSWDSW
ncbi:hypothetical protein [Arthrobacter sp. ZGTC131]|uniref:hypothetical protein n=1 Tax=Arthrobacter sp. ZGTC131 TaxID=2058898 RepID=UPI000CE40782|nr:hypothetical protein [Arthrobacter sp. ZGTC131]